MARRLISTVVVAALLVTAVAASALFALTGCGTLSNLQEKPGYLFFPPHADAPPNRIYGGVRISVKEGWFADVPFSAVADTITLPVTIPATVVRVAAGNKAVKQCPPENAPEGRELAPAGLKSVTTEDREAENRGMKNP
jgi:hypothetical protein